MIHPIKHANMLDLAGYQCYLYAHPHLRYLFLELTDVCNLHCLHCGSGCASSNQNFLDYAAIERVLGGVADKYDPNGIMICITGGEPFLHPDLYRIISLAHSLDFPVGITTNGTLINDASAQHLVEAGLNTIAVSLDGLGAVHDDFRQIPGCFDKAVRGIEALKSAGIEPQVLTVVHRKNLYQLEEMYHFLDNLGIYSWRIVNMDPIGRAISNDDLLLLPEELKSLYEFIREKRFDPKCDMEVTYGCSHFTTLEYENELRDFYFQCGAGTMVASITANGEIRACLDIERRPELCQGNAYRDDFVDVWEHRFEIFRRDRTERSHICRECEHRQICLGDSAHTWNYETDTPNYCAARILEGQI